MQPQLDKDWLKDHFYWQVPRICGQRDCMNLVLPMRNATKKYCSRKCKRSHDNHVSQQHIISDHSPRPCSECGTIFTPARFHPYQKFCCRHCMHNATSRRSHEQMRQNDPDRFRKYKEHMVDETREYRQKAREDGRCIVCLGPNDTDNVTCNTCQDHYVNDFMTVRKWTSDR